eukprot:scaffold10439_cov15-Prasinocladus_malaysianus.AAC.2
MRNRYPVLLHTPKLSRGCPIHLVEKGSRGGDELVVYDPLRQQTVVVAAEEAGGRVQVGELGKIPKRTISVVCLRCIGVANQQPGACWTANAHCAIQKKDAS